MKVLFIGGTGVISSACSQLAIERGFELYLLNRGQTSRAVPEGAKIIRGDIRDQKAVKAALGKMEFDVVVDWICYLPEHLEMDLALFRGRTGQFIFISSASAYQKPPEKLPITELTPLSNPYWQYSRDKIACEERLVQAYQTEQFPMTIVRPSHTYDQTKLPVAAGYTTIARMRQGKPVIVYGDGTSIWVLTHHKDFAKGFVGLLGNQRAIGEAFHITSDELLTWNQIYALLAKAVGVQPKLVHVPSEVLHQFDSEWGAGLLGDKSHSVIFDNTKIKQFVPDYKAKIPFAQGAREIIEWYEADSTRQIVDEKFDHLFDRVIQVFEKHTRSA